MFGKQLRAIGTAASSFWLRACYWWYFSAVGCFIPYIALYYHTLGLSSLQIGVLSAALPFGTAFLAPMWDTLADTFAAHRLLRVALVLAALAGFAVSQATQFVVILLRMSMLAMFAAAIPALIDAYAVTISKQEGTSCGQLRV